MTVDRTVRNGAVKIRWRTYRPVEHHMPYDGRLDGVRFAFGVYSYTTRFVSLHSVAESIHSEDDNAVMEEPHCIDGAYPWRWWFAQEGGG